MRAAVFDQEERLSERVSSVDEADHVITTVISRDQLAESPNQDVVFAIGESALLAFFRASIEVPVIPVEVDAGIPSVPLNTLDSALDSLSEESIDTKSLPTMSVKRGRKTYQALMDIMAVTAEPARISEFQTTKKGTGIVVDQVRADGVTVAGPAGTPGYGTAAGGPILDSELWGLAVVPVGPFRTEQAHWVLDPPIEIEVVREEVPVSLVVDDRTVDTVPAGMPLELSWGEPLPVGILDQSRSPFSTGRREK